MGKNIIHKLCENPCISNLIRDIIEAGSITVKSNIKKQIGGTKKKRIIDIACGTGQFSAIAKGEYVGVDLNKAHIRYARKKYGTKRKKFLVKDASKIDYKDDHFDYAFMLSFLHHTRKKDIGKVLSEAMRITNDKIIIVDLVPLKYNPLGMFFYKMDQGKYIRPFKTQVKLVAKHARILKAYVFRSGMNLHSMIVCDAKKEKKP